MPMMRRKRMSTCKQIMGVLLILGRNMNGSESGKTINNKRRKGSFSPNRRVQRCGRQR